MSALADTRELEDAKAGEYSAATGADAAAASLPQGTAEQKCLRLVPTSYW